MGHFPQEKVRYLHEPQRIQGKVLKRSKVLDFIFLCEKEQIFFYFLKCLACGMSSDIDLIIQNESQGAQLQAKERKWKNPKLTKMKFLLVEGMELAMKK